MFNNNNKRKSGIPERCSGSVKTMQHIVETGTNPIIKEAREILELRRPKLRCNMFKYCVIINHGDGSHFVFNNADAIKKKIQGHNMLLIWTEHCGYHAFFCEDLDGWTKLKQE
jgi:hypothetical protein